MDLDLLQGTWRAVRIETGGSLVPAEIVRYIFDGDRVRLMEGDQPAGEGVICLVPEADPKASTSRPPPARRRGRQPGGSIGSSGTP